MAGKFVIVPTSNGKFAFNLKASNGGVILTSSVMYDTAEAAQAGLEAVRAIALSPIEDQTREEKLEGAKFELYQDKGGQFRFRLKDAAGENLGKSEAYKAKTSAKKGIASVGRNAPEAPVKVEEAKA